MVLFYTQGRSHFDKGGTKKYKGMISALKKEQDKKMQAMLDANTDSLAIFFVNVASTISTSEFICGLCFKLQMMGITLTRQHLCLMISSQY